MQELNGPENFALGSVTALVEGLILQPTVYWKNAAQQGLPFSLDPRVLYRGLGASISSEIGQMALQFFFTGAVKRAVLGDDITRELTPVEEIGSSLVGGALSAFYTTPVELGMIQQQRFGSSFAATAQRCVKESGVRNTLSRGLTPTVARDALYTGGLLGITPAVQRRLMDDWGYSITSSGILASTIGGIICGSLSCPFDAAKTCMQGDLHGKQYKSLSGTMRILARDGRLFAGVGWRCANIVLTIIIANEFRVRVAPLMFPSRFEKPLHH